MIRAVTAATKAKGSDPCSRPRPSRSASPRMEAGAPTTRARAARPPSRAGREFYGVISANPFLDGDALKRLGRGGIGTLRVNFGWGLVQPSRGAPYNWSQYDLEFAGAALHGIRVLATVYGSAIWAEPARTRSARPLPGFTSFVRAAVARYRWPADILEAASRVVRRYARTCFHSPSPPCRGADQLLESHPIDRPSAGLFS